jgi:hypothetical protein
MKKLIATGFALVFAGLMVVPKAHAEEASIRCALNGKQIDIQLTSGNHVNAIITVDGSSKVVSALDTTVSPRDDQVIQEFDSPTTWIIKASGGSGSIKLPSGKWRLLTCGGWVR